MLLPLGGIDKEDAGGGAGAAGGMKCRIVTDAQVVAQPNQLILHVVDWLLFRNRLAQAVPLTLPSL
jgi:hypothetical protein